MCSVSWGIIGWTRFYSVGPGCSSLGVGAFSENGPFRPSGQMLVKNEYSWNKGVCVRLMSTALSTFFCNFAC
jgi:hypothetical protein